MTAHSVSSLLDGQHQRADRTAAAVPVPDDELVATAQDVGSCRLPRDLREGSWAEVLDVVHAAAGLALDLPLADAAIGAALAGTAGLEVPARTVAATGSLTLTPEAGTWCVDGELPRVPWGRAAEHVVVVAGEPPHVLRLRVAAATLTRGTNLAGEPRDTLTYAGHQLSADDLTPAGDLPPDPVLLVGALLRSVAIAGALATLTDLVVEHAGRRRQFGRPLDRFQAVQEHLVRIATESSSATMAASVGRRGLGEDGHPSRFAVAVAKTRSAAAATGATRAAHQVVGAVGTTELHPLGGYSRRLWSWRDEHGSQRLWQRVLGEIALQHAAPDAGAGVHTGLWPLITGDGRTP